MNWINIIILIIYNPNLFILKSSFPFYRWNKDKMTIMFQLWKPAIRIYHSLNATGGLLHATSFYDG